MNDPWGPGSVMLTDRKTKDGNRIGIAFGETGDGRRILELVQIYKGGGVETLEPPAGADGLSRPGKGRPYFLNLPDARRAVEKGWPKS